MTRSRWQNLSPVTRAICYHEAAHGVNGEMLGWKVRLVRLHTRGGGECVFLDDAPAPWVDVVVSGAGHAAERHYCGRVLSGGNRGSRTDRREAAEAMEWAGVTADPEGGRLLLAPGVYLVMLTVNVAFVVAHAPSVTAAVVLGGDSRFKGPRQVVNKKNGNVTAWGVVTVPPGPTAACEVWAEADDEYPTQVTFSRGELLAVLMSQPPEVNS